MRQHYMKNDFDFPKGTKTDFLDRPEVLLQSDVYWVKVLGMLQHAWALMEKGEARIEVYFIRDDSTVFDKLSFRTETEAMRALRHNGYELYTDPAAEFQKYIALPSRPYHYDPDRCYSSGEYWEKPYR